MRTPHAAVLFFLKVNFHSSKHDGRSRRDATLWTVAYAHLNRREKSAMKKMLISILVLAVLCFCTTNIVFQPLLVSEVNIGTLNHGKFEKEGKGTVPMCRNEMPSIV